jgi:hypothetical protein
MGEAGRRLGRAGRGGHLESPYLPRNFLFCSKTAPIIHPSRCSLTKCYTLVNSSWTGFWRATGVGGIGIGGRDLILLVHRFLQWVLLFQAKRFPRARTAIEKTRNHRGCTETGRHSRVTELLALPGRLIQPKGFPKPVARGRRAGVISNLVTSGLPAILRGSSG